MPKGFTITTPRVSTAVYAGCAWVVEITCPIDCCIGDATHLLLGGIFHFRRWSHNKRGRGSLTDSPAMTRRGKMRRVDASPWVWGRAGCGGLAAVTL